MPTNKKYNAKRVIDLMYTMICICADSGKFIRMDDLLRIHRGSHCKMEPDALMYKAIKKFNIKRVDVYARYHKKKKLIKFGYEH